MEVEGLELVELLAYAGRGETWSARDAGTGEACRVTLAAGEGGGPAAAELLHFRHPHAMTVDALLPAPGGRIAVRTEVPPGLTLAALVAARRTLSAAEVVTVGVPVAAALAAAHEAGLVHGDLDLADIALDDRGRPLLLGIGVAGLGGRPAAPADDVETLARLLVALLGDTAGPTADAVRAVLAPALAGHPAARPAAGELSVGLGRACPARAVELTTVVEEYGDPPAAPAAPGWGGPAEGLRWRVRAEQRPDTRLDPLRRVSPRVLVGAGVGAAVLVLVLVVAPARGHGRAPQEDAAAAQPLVLPDDPVAAPVTARPGFGAAVAPATVTPTRSAATAAAPGDWGGVLRELAAARAAAFASGRASALAGADAPGSSAAAVDARRLAAWTASGAHASDSTSELLEVRQVSATASTAVLLSRERLPAYDVLGPDGTVREHRPGGATGTWRVTLVRTAAGWRTASVAAG